MAAVTITTTVKAVDMAAILGPLGVDTVTVANINSEGSAFWALFSFFRKFQAKISYTYSNGNGMGEKTMNHLSGKDERMWAMIVHLSALAGFLIPFGNVLGPLVIWLVKREEGEFFQEHGKEALNFGISITIYAAISGLLLIVFIGAILLTALFIFWIVFVVIAAVRANEGKSYRYPLTLRFVK
ncbi:putative Tic20 family protein [Brevibacillus sp. 1238]|uniref:Orotate phosphoribosyltransferase n=2 Tax=Brevibacillus TaxID=55080 RepID=A0A4Y3PCA3_BREPA|nr:putative Tic20 family protein [Brevibacillus sp. 1238]GEB31114.1 hypothetical protein BPA01_06940 [Brevibacillus parabrevis]